MLYTKNHTKCGENNNPGLSFRHVSQGKQCRPAATDQTEDLQQSVTREWNMDDSSDDWVGDEIRRARGAFACRKWNRTERMEQA